MDITLAKFSAAAGAIVQCFLPAQATGVALRAVLFSKDGKVESPAGRLPYTWPLSIAQVSYNKYKSQMFALRSIIACFQMGQLVMPS